jgi:D-glutamate cyclase
VPAGLEASTSDAAVAAGLAGMPDAARWRRLGEVIDAIAAADVTGRGLSHELHAAARARLGYPLAMGAALLLRDQVSRGDPVLICTGWPSRSWLMSGLTETDGPVGAGYLARVVEQCLGAVPLLVVERSLVPFAEVALRSAGLIVADVETALRAKSGPHNASVGAVVPFTTSWDDAAAEARALFNRLAPAAVVGIEIPGANMDGEFHNVTARLVPTDLVAKADVLVREAAARSVLTVGIGDGGNELGMGFVADAAREHLADGDRIAPVTDVDVLVVGCISNWAAVGVGAALAALGGRPGLLRTVDVGRITERLSDAGAIDGLTSYVDPKNDGTTPAATAAFVELLATAVEMHFGGWEKG